MFLFHFSVCPIQKTWKAKIEKESERERETEPLQLQAVRIWNLISAAADWSQPFYFVKFLNGSFKFHHQNDQNFTSTVLQFTVAAISTNIHFSNMLLLVAKASIIQTEKKIWSVLSKRTHLDGRCRERSLGKATEFDEFYIFHEKGFSLSVTTGPKTAPKSFLSILSQLSDKIVLTLTFVAIEVDFLCIFWDGS